MSLAITRIDTRDAGAGEQIAALRAKLAPEGDVVSAAGRQKTIEVFGQALTPLEVVDRICREVKAGGLDAVLQYTARLDGKQLAAQEIRVSVDELAAAHAAAEPAFLETIRRIRGRILDFQRAILHSDVWLDTEHGGYLAQRYLPLRRVGVCVPGGAAAYPSTVLMTVVPAQAAGVDEIAVVAPPTPFGSYNRDLLATCHELGVTEVYRIGGAQAVAALAYGLKEQTGPAGDRTPPRNPPVEKDGWRLAPVDKIVGPGNLFVALAKRQVFGTVDIDSIAGPSEVIVIADESTRADYTAADLIAQAEHAPGSALLVTWSAKLIDAVAQELDRQLASLARGEAARQSLESFGALILVRDEDEAAALADQLATEHLHLACAEAERLFKKIRYAGAAFIGPFSPVSLGDYAAGPSHVLPTGATARFASGLSANDFLRSNSVIHFTQAGLENIADDVVRLAEKEGLTGHARSVELRRRESR